MPMRRRHWPVWVLLTGTLAAFLHGACDLPFGDDLIIRGPIGDPIPPIPAATINLRVENRSGVQAQVEAVFFVRDRAVRRTVRRINPEGTTSSVEVLPTDTDRLAISAIATGEPPLLARGTPLASDEFILGDDFEDEADITFIVPPHIDCNQNGRFDAVDIAQGTSDDCDEDGVPDECPLADDCNEDGVPDSCQPDCDESGVPDDCEFVGRDCDDNGVLDDCELAGRDCDDNGVLDECELDGHDCNENGVLDDCETDCNENGRPDECDLADVEGSSDCDGDGVPDECPLAVDCNGNDVPDPCEVDCNENGQPDDCDIASGFSDDCQPNGIPDECDIGIDHGPPVDRRLRAKEIGAPGLLFPLDDSFQLALPPNDDESTTEIPLNFTFDFYGSTYTSVFINNNGNLSFGGPFENFSSTGFPIAGFPMIAPFWGDVDTRDELGAVWIKQTEHALIVTWDRVGYFLRHGDRRNTFQVSISDGFDFTIGIDNNVAFSYGDMAWTTGDASEGQGGFGGVPATAGGNRGNGDDFFLIGRFDHEGTDYDGPGGQSDGVSFLDGQIFRFKVSTREPNIAPIPVNVPEGRVRLFARRGDVFDVTIPFLSPEEGQITTVELDDPDGALENGLVFEPTAGNPGSARLVWAPHCGQTGDYRLVLTARDDFIIPGETVVVVDVSVRCGNEDCNGNGVPDECEDVVCVE